MIIDAIMSIHVNFSNKNGYEKLKIYEKTPTNTNLWQTLWSYDRISQGNADSKYFRAQWRQTFKKEEGLAQQWHD